MRDRNLKNAECVCLIRAEYLHYSKENYLVFIFERGVERSDRRQHGGLLQHPRSV